MQYKLWQSGLSPSVAMATSLINNIKLTKDSFYSALRKA